MDYITCERDGQLLVVTLARGKANALNSAMVEELIAAVSSAAASEDVRGVVLASDRPKFFSGGFDVVEVFGYDRKTMTEFFGRFIDLYEKMLRLPKPLVAAVSGHAYAGGAVLALACDARVIAQGEFGFALNEINLGMALPPGMIRLATHAVGAGNAWDMVLRGQTVTPSRALEIGLAADAVDPKTVLERAKELARELADKPPLTFAVVKQQFLEVTGHHPTGNDREWLDRFIEHWFSAETMERKDALIQSIRR
jgi:enoyl-CoA hydratase/carnithine racemase